jgi:hypothetical protein
LGVTRQGVFKNTTIIFLQKVHVKNFLSTFLFYRVLSVCQRKELKNTTKPSQKNRFEKNTQKSKEINWALLLFWPPTHPHTTGVTARRRIFVLAAPWL